MVDALDHVGYQLDARWCVDDVRPAEIRRDRPDAMTDQIISAVWVPGHPRTKGSLTFRGKHAEEAPGVDEWRNKVAVAVKADVLKRHILAGRNGVLAYDGPVSVNLTFWLEPPSHAPRELRNPKWWSMLKGWLAAIWPRAGDIDKLSRCILDAIAVDKDKPAFSGNAILDDNQVVHLSAIKHPSEGYAGDSGVLIFIRQYDAYPDLARDIRTSVQNGRY
jgi:Holliday junction resolvase RusA-like endonuclease